MRRWWQIGLGLGLGLGGCASGTTSGPRPRTGLRPPAVSVRSYGMVVPPIGAPRVLHREQGGAVHYAVGGIRVMLREGGTSVGEQAFASTLVGAAQVRAGGWLFVAQSGTVAKATEFTGTLTYVRTLPGTVVRAFGWQGGLAAVLADGRILRADAEEPARNVVPGSALTNPAAAPEDAPEFEAVQVAQAAVEHFPAARLALPSSVLLGNGTVAVRGGDRLFFATVTSRTGFVPIGYAALTGEVAGTCDMTPWGARALITCPALRADMPDALQPVTPYVARTDGVERAGDPGLGSVLAGRDGHTLTRRGPCPGPDAPPEPPGPRGPTYSCTLDQERGWREWQYPGNASVVDVYDGYALVSETRAGSAGPELKLYQIDMGQLVGRPLVSDPTVQIARAGFTPDGRIIVLAHSGTDQTPPAQRRSHVGIAPVGEVINLHSLGFFARDVAMADAEHGLAVGVNAHDVVETVNGGISWMRVDVALDGDPARVSLEPGGGDAGGGAGGGVGLGGERVRRNGETVECSPLACRAAGRLVHWWGEMANAVPAME